MPNLIWILLAACVLSACQSTPTHNTQSGSIIDYGALKPAVGFDGEEVLRSVDPAIHQYSFKELVLDPVILSAENTHSQVDPEVLKEARRYFDSRLRKGLSTHHQLVKKPKTGVPRLRVALTGVQLDSEGLKVTELLPFGAAIGLIRTATGTRNQEVTMFVEVIVEDSLSGKHLASIVRSGQGSDIRMIWSPELTLEHAQPLLDDWVSLATDSFASMPQQ